MPSWIDKFLPVDELQSATPVRALVQRGHERQRLRCDWIHLAD